MMSCSKPTAAQRAFDDPTDHKADNTIGRKMADLALFETFLNGAGVPAAGLVEDPRPWAGAITAEESILISSVQEYATKEARHVDEKRRAESIQTRVGHKKAEALTIPVDIANALKQQPNTPQGRWDALLMCILVDRGLRVGEIAILTKQNFDLQAGTFTFKRPQVNIEQTHELTKDTRCAASAYFSKDSPADGILWRRSCKGTSKLSWQVSDRSAERALTKRVERVAK